MSRTPVEILKKIRKIQIETTKLASDILAGAYLSAFKGKGMEFEDVRSYQYGDEIRSIDWKVTARMDHPYVKNFREERDIDVTIAVDLSASSVFGSTSHLKSELIAEISALIAFSAIKNHDKIGLILFSDHVEKYIPPKKGLRHVLHIILELLTYKAVSKKTSIKNALDYIGNITRKSGVYFMISDFIDEGYFDQAALIAKKCDLIAIQLIDKNEVTLPELSLVTLQDAENGTLEVFDFMDSKFRTDYEIKSKERIQHVEKMMAKIHAGCINIYTDRPYIKEILKFFKIRGRKRR